MPYHDLNLSYSSPTATSVLAHNLSFASDLGYSIIAFSLSIDGKLPSNLPTIPISDIPKPENMTLLTRLTLTISDTSQNHRLSTLSSVYSLLALRPVNEASFQHCCLSLDCDIISLDLSHRLPFIIKFKTVSSALQRGIRFEICYSPGVTGGTDARRNVISGATALIRATRGRGIILSSEAKTALGLRAPHDVMNLAQVWGLGQERGKEAVCEEAERVIRLARLRRESYRGVIGIIDGGEPSKQEQERTKKPTLAKDPKSVNESIQPNGTDGMKRKASNTSLTNPTATQTDADDKPLSKREQKRRAKKARLDAQIQDQSTLNMGTNNSFPIKHEVLPLAGGSSKVSKKS